MGKKNTKIFRRKMNLPLPATIYFFSIEQEHKFSALKKEKNQLNKISGQCHSFPRVQQDSAAANNANIWSHFEIESNELLSWWRPAYSLVSARLRCMHAYAYNIIYLLQNFRVAQSAFLQNIHNTHT